MKSPFHVGDPEDTTWKIVYMDMITMLMMLFLSLWIMDRRRTNEEHKQGDITLTKVQFEADEYFDPGKAIIRPEARKKMKDLFFNSKSPFPALGRDLNLGGRRIVLIQGHTDDQGDKRENFELGFQRALAVYDELDGKISNFSGNVGICSFADNFPIGKIRGLPSGTSRSIASKVVQENSKKRKKNRRFEILGQFESQEDLASGL